MKLTGDVSTLLPLDNRDAGTFAGFLSLGLNFQYTFTGSIPMRPIDVEKEWDAERARGSVQWGIFMKYKKYPEDMTFVGTTGLYSHRDIYRSWEFRILIGHPEAIGHGIGTEVTRMVVDWGFKRLNAHRIWLGVNVENERAVRCYKTVGFKEEGRLRDDIYCGGKYVDTFRMSLLESDWTSHSSVKAE